MKVCNSCLLFFLLSIAVSYSQSIQNVKATPREESFIVTYDLVAAKPTQTFTIELYGSNNNFLSPLTLVSGDVGKEVSPGQNKQIIWRAAEELGVYKGEITFRVKGRLNVPPFLFKKPAEGDVVRRGKTTTLEWEGGTDVQNIKIQLIKGSEQISTIAEMKNTGQYEWNIPKKLSTGTYTLVLNTAEQGQVSSKNLKVKSKIPLILKIIPIAIIGGVVVWQVTQEPSNDLPAAPEPN